MGDEKRKKYMILSAEDDLDDRVTIMEALGQISRSLNLHFVDDGLELLGFLYTIGKMDENDFMLPDLILLDIRMPIMDGREALKRIKKDVRLSAIPVVIFTTSNEEEDRAICGDLGANDYVAKPSTYEEIVEALRAIVLKWLPRALNS